MNQLKVDAAGRAFLTQQEGEVLHAYQDAGGVWTIGVGHVSKSVVRGMVITHEQSQALLSSDLARFERAVNACVSRVLTQHEFNALLSFAFNLGEESLFHSSLLGLVNAGSQNAAALTERFRIWNKVNGLPNAGIEARRLREAALFLTP